MGEELGQVAKASEGIRLQAAEIGLASDDLSKRTEQQAASLEETAAALDQITATVKRTSATGAKQASTVVATGRDRCRALGRGGPRGFSAPWARSRPRRARSARSSA